MIEDRLWGLMIRNQVEQQQQQEKDKRQKKTKKQKNKKTVSYHFTQQIDTDLKIGQSIPGVPVVAQQKRICLGTMRLRV